MPEAPTPIAKFFQAMQAGAAAEKDMESLFADDATYSEPFSGKPTTHRGRAAIMNAMRTGWAHPLPDMTISIDRVDLAENEVVVRWTCRSPALPGGSGTGCNRFVLEKGKIAKLETTLG